MYACTSFQWITAAISHFPSKRLLHSSLHIHASDYILTAANLSKRANSSLRVITSSCAVHCDARLVKPSMSANKMLQKHKDKRDRIHSEKLFSNSLNSLYWSDFPADHTFTWRGRKTRYCMLTKMSKGYLWVLLFTSLWWTSLQSINPLKSSES